MDDTQPLNLTELARALNRSYQYAKDLKKAGMPMAGNCITAAEAWAWAKANPDFRAIARERRATQPWPSRR